MGLKTVQNSNFSGLSGLPQRQWRDIGLQCHDIAFYSAVGFIFQLVRAITSSFQLEVERVRCRWKAH